MTKIRPFTAEMTAAIAPLTGMTGGVVDGSADWRDEADASVTTGYDLDGSTGIEIFESACELVFKAAGRQIWSFEDTAYEPAIVTFWIGTAEEVVDRICQVQ